MWRDPPFIGMCVAFVLLTLLAGAPDLIDYDSTQFALALDQHDLRFHQPQPPGFVLFVSLARFVKAFVGDAYLSLRLVAIVLLVTSATFLGKLALAVYGRATARLAVALFLSSPLVLFHGMTTMIYPTEALIAAVVAYFSFKALRGSEHDLRLLAFLVGLLAGVRQTALVFSIPLLFLVAKRGTFGRHAIDRAALAWSLGVLAWLLPQFKVSGGFDGYLRSNLLLQSHLFAESPFRGGIPPLEDHLRRALNVLLFGLGAFRLLFLASAWRSGRRNRQPPTEKNVTAQLDSGFYLAWLLPPVLLFVFYHFPKSGYALAIWPGLVLLTAHQLRSRGAFVRARGLKNFVVAGVLALDVLLFFFLPAVHIGQEPWDLPTLPPATEGRRTAPIGWWQDIDAAPALVRRPIKLLFGRVDFFFDRTRGFKFGGFLAALRSAGLPREDILLIGQDATRVACYGLPEQSLVHVDPVRPEPFLIYKARRAKRLGDSFVLPDGIRWLLIEGPADSLSFEAPELPQSRQKLTGPLAGHFELLEIGEGALRASYRPRVVAGAPPVQLELIRTPKHAREEPTTGMQD